MNKIVQESTDREIISAIGADEQANTNNYQILRRFVSCKASISGEETHQPRTVYSYPVMLFVFQARHPSVDCQ